MKHILDSIGSVQQIPETHLFDLMKKFFTMDGVTMIYLGYTADGMMADIRYSLDHKDYIITITEKK